MATGCACGDGRVSHEDVIGRVAVFIAGDSQSAGRVGLRITIDEQASKTLESERGGEVDCGSGFSNPALLVDDRDDFTHA